MCSGLFENEGRLEYRDTFRLLLRYAGVRCGKPPVKLTVEDIGADLVADFLVHTETARD